MQKFVAQNKHFHALMKLVKATDLAGAILNLENNRSTPEQMTVCSTLYLDMDDCDGVMEGEPKTSFRTYPTWSILNKEGKTEMSFFLEQNFEKFSLVMGAHDQIYNSIPYTIGKLKSRFKLNEAIGWILS